MYRFELLTQTISGSTIILGLCIIAIFLAQLLAGKRPKTCVISSFVDWCGTTGLYLQNVFNLICNLMCLAISNVYVLLMTLIHE